MYQKKKSKATSPFRNAFTQKLGTFIQDKFAVLELEQ